MAVAKVYAENQLCRHCLEKLGADHRFNTCPKCILKAVKKYNPKLASYDELMEYGKNGYASTMVWRDLKIGERKPISEDCL